MDEESLQNTYGLKGFSHPVLNSKMTLFVYGSAAQQNNSNDESTHMEAAAIEVSILSQRSVEKTGRATDFRHQPLIQYNAM